MLKLMYITNRPDVAQIAQAAGVDRIFVDLEYIDKAQRQGGMDTVQSHHTLEDIKTLRGVLTTSQLLVRVNRMHEASDEYGSSQEEIDTAIANGADILMLPYFKTVQEVSDFLSCVRGRVQTMLLLETPEAVQILDEILALPGINSIHIGLNDLSLGYGMRFMFQPLANGMVEDLCRKIGAKGIAYGFGGIAALGKGMVPAEMIIKEHYRLGSTAAILSRSFCDVNKVQPDAIETVFTDGVKQIRQLESECQMHMQYFTDNQRRFAQAVEQVIRQIQ